MTKLHLHIGHLSLPAGFSPAQQREYIAALEQQIAARIANGASPSSLGPASCSLKTRTTADLQPATLARETADALNIAPSKGAAKQRGEAS